MTLYPYPPPQDPDLRTSPTIRVFSSQGRGAVLIRMRLQTHSRTLYSAHTADLEYVITLYTYAPLREVTSSHLQFIPHPTSPFGVWGCKRQVQDLSSDLLTCLSPGTQFVLSPVFLLFIPSVIFSSTPFTLMGFLNTSDHCEPPSFPLWKSLASSGGWLVSVRYGL